MSYLCIRVFVLAVLRSVPTQHMLHVSKSDRAKMLHHNDSDAKNIWICPGSSPVSLRTCSTLKISTVIVTVCPPYIDYVTSMQRSGTTIEPYYQHFPQPQGGGEIVRSRCIHGICCFFNGQNLTTHTSTTSHNHRGRVNRQYDCVQQ